MTTSIATILAQAAQLSVEDQLLLNKGLCDMIRRGRKVQQATTAMKFVPGNVIKFFKSGRGRNAGTHYVRVEGFNRAGTCIVGYECDANGNKLPLSPKWTVASTVCTLVNVAA